MTKWCFCLFEEDNKLRKLRERQGGERRLVAFSHQLIYEQVFTRWLANMFPVWGVSRQTHNLFEMAGSMIEQTLDANYQDVTLQIRKQSKSPTRRGIWLKLWEQNAIFILRFVSLGVCQQQHHQVWSYRLEMRNHRFSCGGKMRALRPLLAAS